MSIPLRKLWVGTIIAALLGASAAPALARSASGVHDSARAAAVVRANHSAGKVRVARLSRADSGRRAARHSAATAGTRVQRGRAKFSQPETVVAKAPLPLVVIDAGHGGRDSGAIGAAGTLEKTVTLLAAKEIQERLLATRRYRVLLTRANDSFVPLSARLAVARSHHADLFISVHANASRDHSARGASVYVRSGAAPGMNMPGLIAPEHGAGGIVQAISGQQPITWLRDAALLQYTMIDNLNDDIRMTAAPARQEHLYVLADSSIPSVLLEMGFLSNRKDEALLKSSRYRRMIAEAIVEAVDDYFEDLKRRAL